MGARRRKQPGGSGATKRLLLVDAGMLAGWRLAKPSLAQLDEAVAHLREDPDLQVVILADASLKRELSKAEQDRFERYRADGTLVGAPAGSIGGHSEFLRAAAERACAKGSFAEVLVLTARDIGRGKWTLVRVLRDGDHWSIEPSAVAAR